MDKKTEALKLALEALEDTLSGDLTPYQAAKTITVLRKALAEQPAQPYPDNFIHALMYDVAKRDSEAQQPVVEHPPCQGVNCGITRTDQEHSLECQAEHAAAIAGGAFVKPAQQQEPVAWMHPNWPNYTGTQSPVTTYMVNGWKPLYTSPPHRKPLTDEEIVQIELGLRQYNNRDTYDLSLKDFARAIEAAHGIKENKK